MTEAPLVAVGEVLHAAETESVKEAIAQLRDELAQRLLALDRLATRHRGVRVAQQLEGGSGAL